MEARISSLDGGVSVGFGLQGSCEAVSQMYHREQEHSLGPEGTDSDLVENELQIYPQDVDDLHFQ